jgi:tight adherence protein C
VPLPVILAAAAIGLSLPLLIWALAAGRPQHATAASNLHQGLERSTNLRDLTLARSASERTLRPVAGALARMARRISPAGFTSALERRIVLAGRPLRWPLERVLAVKLVLGLVGILVGLLSFVADPSIGRVILAALLTTAGFLTPDLVLWQRGAARQEAIQLALPDTLDQMLICVQAGLGFEAALARAGQSGRGALADELVRTLQEMQVGATRAEAIRSLTDRTEVPELRQFAVALLQAETYGLPMSAVLRTQADEQRVRRRQRAEERAMKIPVKIVFPLVLCILPAMFIVALGPSVIRILEFFGG